MEMTVQDNRKEVFKSLFSYSALGIEMGLCVAIGFAAGYYLDRYFGTNPYLTLIFVFFGIAAAFRAVYRAYKEGLRDDERNNNR